MNMQIIEKAAAKINLSLDTPFNHADGKQEWQMIMTSVDLADYVTIETLDHTMRIEVLNDTGFLPNDRRNLVYQAAKLLQKSFKIKQGVKISIEKHIPVAAGLGGGSSDAAAVLRGLNKLWDLNLSLAQLAILGLDIDADVPYCVYSQTAYVHGKGEKIELLEKLPTAWVILAKPNISVSTPSILRQIDHAKLKHINTPRLKQVINDQAYQQMYQLMGNVLEPVTCQQHNQIMQLKERMLTYGANVAQMSGTGPTVFGICEKQSRAQRVYNSMKGFCRETYLVRTLG